MMIQEVAELTGISAYTIRFYEKSGVLPPVQRTESGNSAIYRGRCQLSSVLVGTEADRDVSGRDR